MVTPTNIVFENATIATYGIVSELQRRAIDVQMGERRIRGCSFIVPSSQAPRATATILDEAGKLDIESFEITLMKLPHPATDGHRITFTMQPRSSSAQAINTSGLLDVIGKARYAIYANPRTTPMVQEATTAGFWLKQNVEGDWNFRGRLDCHTL